MSQTPQTKTKSTFPSRVWANQNVPAQNIPSNANTPIRMDAEQFDSMGEFNLVTDIFTAVRTGYYFAIARATWQVIVAAGIRRVWIQANGVPVAATDVQATNVNMNIRQECSAIVQLNAGQTIRAYVYQDSGFAEALIQPAGNIHSNVLMIHRLS